MSTLTSQQANELAADFSKIADEVRDYWITNIDRLSPQEQETFLQQMNELWAKANSMYTLSAILVLDDLSTSLQRIRGIQSEIQRTLKTMANVQRAIDITGAAIAVAGALLSKDPKEIGTSIEGLAIKLGSA